MRLLLCALPALLGDARPEGLPVRLVGSVRLSLLAKGRWRRCLGRAVAPRLQRDGGDEARSGRCQGNDVGAAPERPGATEATAARGGWSGRAIGALGGAVAGRGVVEDASWLARGRIGLILRRAGLREDVDARGRDGERACVGDCGSGCHRPTEGQPADLAPKNFSRPRTRSAGGLQRPFWPARIEAGQHNQRGTTRRARSGALGLLGGGPATMLLLAHVPVNGVGGDHRDERSKDHGALSLISSESTRCRSLPSPSVPL